MPVASLLGKSQMLVEGGWIRISNWSDQPLLGLDRHGQLATATVSVEPSDPCSAAYLGTRHSIATIGSKAAIVDAGGTKVPIERLVQQSTVSEHRFETVWPREIGRDRGTAESLWQSAHALAVARKEDTIAIASLSISQNSSCQTSALTIAKQDLAPDLPQLGALFERIGECRADDEGGFVFDRGEIEFLIWFLTVQRLNGRKYVLSYDTLQHTSTVRVTIETGTTASDLKGACAFATPGLWQGFRLSWTAPGWNPICSGLILAGDV